MSNYYIDLLFCDNNNTKLLYNYSIITQYERHIHIIYTNEKINTFQDQASSGLGTKVQLRNKESVRQQRFKECRRSSGYHSNSSVATVFESSNSSQRDRLSLVLSSGYNSPSSSASGRSSLLLEGEEEESFALRTYYTQSHAELHKTDSNDSACPSLNNSPLVTSSYLAGESEYFNNY